MNSLIDSMVDKACGYEEESNQSAPRTPEELAQDVAVHVKHYIRTMYPAMLQGVPRTAETSVRNMIIVQTKIALEENSKQ